MRCSYTDIGAREAEHVGIIVCFLKLYWDTVIYNVVLVSGVQQSDSVIHIHISILFQIIFFYSYYKILNRVPCAVQ